MHRFVLAPSVFFFVARLSRKVKTSPLLRVEDEGERGPGDCQFYRLPHTNIRLGVPVASRITPGMAAASLRRPNFYRSIGFGIVPDNPYDVHSHSRQLPRRTHSNTVHLRKVRHFVHCPGSRWIDRGIGVPAQLSGCRRGQSSIFRSLRPRLSSRCRRPWPNKIRLHQVWHFQGCFSCG